MHWTFRLALGLLALVSGPVPAQVSVRNTFIDKAAITADGAPTGSEVARVGMNIVDFEVAFPLIRRMSEERGILILENTLRLRRHAFTYDWPAGNDEYKPDVVYGFSYGLTMIRSLGRTWRNIAFVTAGVYSDLEDFGGDDFLIEGGALFVRNAGPNWELGLGPVFTYAFGNPILVPAPYARYRGTGKYIVDVSPPRYAVVAVRPSERASIGVALRSVFNNYNLGDPRQLDPDGKNTWVVFSDVTAGVETELGLGGGLTVDAGVATTLNRTLKINDHAGDRIVDRDLDNALVVRVGLSYRPR